MKKIVSLLFAGALIFGSANAQILSEQNVTINMDLQPVLQLSMEGSDVIDFSFTDVNQYLGGVVKNGATTLKVSASMSFDLWAVGYSGGQTQNFCMDQTASYDDGTAIAGSTDQIPLTALEIHQFPPNPILANAAATTCGNGNLLDVQAAAAGLIDYSRQFETDSTGIDAATVGATVGTSSFNNVYVVQAGNSLYLAPSDLGTTPDRYIAGYKGTNDGCQIPGGSYLTAPYNSDATAGAPTAGADGAFANSGDFSGYLFVLDYRMLPGLPAMFPFAHPRRMVNGNSTANEAIRASLENANSLLGDNSNNFNVNGVNFAAPGSYRMFVKYILAQDQ